jgi:RNA polymerase sigma-70 factor, ECF subfamily
MHAEDKTLEKKADDSIRAALAQDDPAAIERIWGRYAGDLLAMLQARLGSRHDGEDVLQAVFVRIVRNRHWLAKARCLDSYIFRMARNEAAGYARRRGRTERTLPDPWLVASDDGHEHSDHIDQLQNALAQLPAEQREVIVLKVYREKTFAEIARMLGVSQNTVASRYRYAIEKLHKLLKEPEP